LPQRRDATEDAVTRKDLALRVSQDGEWKRVARQVASRLFHGRGGDGDDLGVRTAKVRLMLRQTAEVPPAERSEETSEEDQHDAGAATEVSKGHRGPAGGGKAERRRR
jgi:hypothetical protein